jgi:predicted metal-binding membrane protein
MTTSGSRAVLIPVGLLTTVCWLYLVNVGATTGAASAGSQMAMPTDQAWTPAIFANMYLMWAVMMVAMMLPSATPLVMLHARVVGLRRSQGRPAHPTSLFVLGYLVVWLSFSLAATLANWALHQGGGLDTIMGRAAPAVSGAVLVAAGIYQWSSVKDACLAHCRSPVGFLTHQWREGAGGAVVMGVRHGTYCVGCCWLLMALLFVLGVMNLAWIAVLTILVLLEKAVRQGPIIARASGIAMVAWGATLLLRG